MLEAHGAIDALESVTARKNGYADQLAAADTLRGKLLYQAGFTNSDNALQHAARKHAELAAPVEHLLSLAQRASALNTANGITISAYLAHNRLALNELQHLVGAGNLYDAQGRSKRGAASTLANVRAG